MWRKYPYLVKIIRILSAGQKFYCRQDVPLWNENHLFMHICELSLIYIE